MKLLKTITFFLTLNLCIAFSAHADPTIYTLVMDASGSISQADWRKENAAAAAFVTVLYGVSQMEENIGKLADQISVAWFGGKDQYAQLPYLNASDKNNVGVLVRSLEQANHPEFGHTAIYSAIAKATIVAIEKEEALGHDYNQVIILVTDGKDTQSPYEMRQLFEKIYPNNEVFLAVIGVGSKAKMAPFRPYADDVRHINDFAELAAALAIYSAKFR